MASVENIKVQPLATTKPEVDKKISGSDPKAFKAELDKLGSKPDQGLTNQANLTNPTGLANPAGATNSTGSVNPTESTLKFSAHAVERMRSRGISFPSETVKNIEGAVQKAAAKGSKDTLVLAGDAALVVSVKNNTVVTVMDRNAMKENVFTNIDSTVVL